VWFWQWWLGDAMSNVSQLADHPKRKDLTEKMRKLRDGLCAGLTADQIIQQEVDREAHIIAAAMDRIAGYTLSKSAMVDVVEKLLQAKVGGAVR
jgi:hypothetical protein